MVSKLLYRLLRALPIYALGVVGVIGVSHLFEDDAVIAATHPEVEQPAPRTATVVVFIGHIPLLIPLPTRID